MIASCHRRRRKAARWIAAALAMAGVALSGPAASAEDGLLARCWPAGELSAREAESRPVRGAPGHAQPNPGAALDGLDRVPPAAAGVVRRVALPKGVKLVALTLDLCEQNGELAGYDGPIFDLLRRHGVRATVFAGGKWLMSHPERARQLIADPLLEIGNHGWAHRNVRGLDGGGLLAEIRGPLAAYQIQRRALAAMQCAREVPALMSARPERLSLYRFPFGACNPQALAALPAHGLLAIQWDVSTGDAAPGQSPEAFAASMIARIRPGSIVLAHANGRGHGTAAALAIAIPRLKAMGYTFATVGEMMAQGRAVTVDTCYDSRPGDTDRYDALFAPRIGRPAVQSRAAPLAPSPAPWLPPWAKP